MTEKLLQALTKEELIDLILSVDLLDHEIIERYVKSKEYYSSSKQYNN